MTAHRDDLVETLLNESFKGQEGMRAKAAKEIISLRARVAELESNERAYEDIIGPMTYREVADEIERLQEAKRRALAIADERAKEACARAVQRPAEEIQEVAANAIRTFCQSLGANTVAVSGGVKRVYYAGLSLDALAVAVALALSSTVGNNK